MVGERPAWPGVPFGAGVLSGAVLRLVGFVFPSREAVLISEEELMDVRALQRQGLSYAEIGRLLGRDWRTVKRYVEHGAQPVYRRRRAPSKLDEFKPLIDQWLAGEPRLLSTRIHQNLVRDYGFQGGYDTVRRYVERARPRREQKVEKRFETAAGHQAQIDWSHEQPIRRYAVPDAKPGERVELLLGAQELEAYRISDGSRLARHRRGAPAKIAPDPGNPSVSLAAVLGALPDPEVHARPLSRFEEALHG